MFWTLLSIAVCTGLVVRLLFWTDEHRRESRWYYRVLLFVVTVYAANNVVNFLYNPTDSVSPWMALFHAVLFFGAFIIKPHHLPWNGHHDLASEARSSRSDVTTRLRYGLRDKGLHGGEGQAGSRKYGTITGTHRIR